MMEKTKPESTTYKARLREDTKDKETKLKSRSRSTPRKRATPKRKKLIAVKVIRRAEQTALVQWLDGTMQRAYVPASEVTGGKANADVLNAGIPYGAPWEEILTGILNSQDISPEAIASALRRRGIWTAEDMERDPRNSKRAIDETIGIRIGELCRRARHNRR